MFGRKNKNSSDEPTFFGNLFFEDTQNNSQEFSAAETNSAAAPSSAPLSENKPKEAETNNRNHAHVPPKKAVKAIKKEEKKIPELYQSLDLTKESLIDFLQKEKGPAEAEQEPDTDLAKKEKSEAKKAKIKRKKGKLLRDIQRPPLTGEEMVKASLDGMYEVYRNPAKNKKRILSAADYVRYGILFVCIFGFLSAGFFVFHKLYDYYRAYVVYSGLQEMVSTKDYFAAEYLKKSLPATDSLTPAEILAGKTPDGSESVGAYTEEQETLVSKIAQLKKINSDTAGWITIKGTVVNYPLVWSEKRNYYLKRDFYGNVLSGGSIFIDERNDADLTKNKNTVIYGHNMSDGSMFASVHDFSNASVFYGATIEIATQNGIFVYTPFSVHSSNAFDNYFETNFVSDEDFLDFCEQMKFISLYETDFTFNKNSQIITLSTCTNDQNSSENRFAVHAVLTKVIR